MVSEESEVRDGEKGWTGSGGWESAVTNEVIKRKGAIQADRMGRDAGGSERRSRG